ncbi:MAG TPA: glycosyltransferase family 4 protein [Bacteroidota bacterium]|nr:glycosyltransferase family 4 protein [Bacteroidota bacterium]
MKILVINWQDIKHPLGGGAEVHLHEIFRRIVVRGHSVTLFCSIFGDAPREETIDGIRVLRSGGRHLFNFRVPLRYRMEFRHAGFDVVVDDMNKIPFFTPWFVKEPLVGMVLHLFRASIFREAFFPIALYVYLAERLALRVYRKVPMAVISKSTEEELERYGFPASRLRDVRIAVDRERYRELGIPKSPVPMIGYLGRIKKYKSVDHLLKAFNIIRSQVKDAKLVIIGDGDGLPELKKLAQTLGIADAVTFTGFVPLDEKVRLINQMHVVVNTSAKEGWGLTVTEANVCGVPVVASDVPGLRDAVKDGETGLLYKYGNIEQLADLVLRLLHDEPLRQRLAAEAKKYAATFNWDDCADRMLKLLEETVERRRNEGR